MSDRLIESGSDGEFVELADDLLDRVTQDYPSAPATVVRRSKQGSSAARRSLALEDGKFNGAMGSISAFTPQAQAAVRAVRLRSGITWPDWRTSSVKSAHDCISSRRSSL